ncbi:MAG: barstar family protein [Erysipelotrichaceae bacterium]|nr:barstar family protein [Erysipelotrichaceae bacterium]
MDHQLWRHERFLCHDLKTLQRRQRRLRQHLSGLCRYKPAGDRKKDRHGHQGTQRQRSPYLKELFDFPDYYGENLDALYDCLCDLDNTQVIVMNCDDLNKFSLKVLDVFDEIADEYGNIKISYEYEEEEETE